MNAEARFIDFLRAVGIAPFGAVVVSDGRGHRYRVVGDKSGSKYGWCIMRFDPIPCGYAASFRTGDTHPWRDPDARPINRTERSRLHRCMVEMRNHWYQAQLVNWREARTRAEKLWRITRPVDSHPFLLKERIKPFGIRKLRDMLLIPARDVEGKIHSLQFILADGTTRFISGGNVKGCYYAIGRPGCVLYVCEHYLIAARIHGATGHAVALAFTFENLVPVWRKMFIKFPRVKIFIAADDGAAIPDMDGFIQTRHISEILAGGAGGQ